jgi:hypothetical protein
VVVLVAVSAKTAFGTIALPSGIVSDRSARWRCCLHTCVKGHVIIDLHT